MTKESPGVLLNWKPITYTHDCKKTISRRHQTMEMETSKGKGCIGLFFSMGIFLLIGLGLTYWGWNILQNARASASWPTANGIITQSVVSHSTDSDGGDTYSPEVTYSYKVDNTNYINSTIKFGENSYGNRGKAEEIAGNYHVGKKVTVYYDPEKPDHSVLEPGVSAGSYIVIGIGVFFIIITFVAVLISIFAGNKGQS